MNQDILNLYKKAQNAGLNAQEVFWLEGQAAAHPSFGMVYMILARHHYRNQSTIKNKALLKAAAYANNRTLLRNYLEDTLSVPKSRPVPVSETKPNLQKKETPQETAPVQPDPKNVTAEGPKSLETTPVEPISPVVQTPPVEAPAVVSPPSELPSAEDAEIVTNSVDATEVEAATKETPTVAENAEVNPTEETAAIETPDSGPSEMTAEPVAETSVVETPAAELPVVDTPAGEPQQPESIATESGTVEIPALESTKIESESAPEAPVHYLPAGQINWFLQMRVKLRADKYKSLGNRIRASVEKHSAVAANTVAVSAPPVEVSLPHTEAPVAEIQLEAPATEVIQEAPANESILEAKPIDLAVDAPSVEIAADAPNAESNKETSEPEAAPAFELLPETPVMESPAPEVENPAKVEENSLQPETQEEAPASESSNPVEGASKVATTVSTKPETKVKTVVPDKEYEIGSFSSFTFLPEGEGDDSEEVIDTGLATLEAVEFQTVDFSGGSGEIIFEENDRIVEISVSPEALSKYFKGRLPAEQPMTFGEFKIEFDDLEYRDSGKAAKAEKEEAGTEEVEAESAGTLEFASQPMEQPKKKVDEILEKFIENEPAITRGNLANSPTGDLAKDSSQLHDDWVTETLARIYAKQGNKAKAIKIYGKLRLRFPEKSDYFGTLIENLKQ